MHDPTSRLLFAFLLAAVATACTTAPPPLPAAPDPTAAPSEDAFDVLVFSKTNGFRHASIPAGIEAVRTLGAEHGFRVEATEDASAFTRDGLAPYEAVVFMNTNGDVLEAAQQAALEAYVRAGGGFVGVHSAAATEYEWEWYGRLVGAHFDDHPRVQEAVVRVTDRTHASTRHLPVRWTRRDEWYNYRTHPRGAVHVLATVDEATYEGGTMGADHPIAWAHRFDGGRAWYTGLGHTDESYADPLFRRHLLGGIRWAAGAEPADAAATVAGAFEKVVLTGTVTDPMELAVAPDGRVFFVEREGAVKVWSPETGETTTAGYIPTLAIHNEGMMGLALDPDFAENGWLYVFHTPQTERPVNVVARYTVRNDGPRGPRLDPASRRELLAVPTQREECCHSGGSIAFGPDGNLYVATGDNTNPHASDGYAPLDERPGREAWDAQRSSGDTRDLRGKILRIRPTDDGSYEIPEGNLFPGGAAGRPEIYVMGTRNPYRISIDPATGWLYWGEVGPDAGVPSAERGPTGYDEINQAREAGNFGWPYFIAHNRPYHDFDFATQTPGPAYDPERPVNESPNRTGARVLPPARPAMIWYPYGPSEEFPILGSGGRVAMAGPVYHRPDDPHPRALPAYYDGKLFIYDWMRSTLFAVTLDDDGRVAAIEPFLADVPLHRPHDLEIGPGGRLFAIEWGTDYGGNNLDAQIVRLDYYGTAERPPAVFAQAETAQPRLAFTRPVHGGFFDYGAPIPYRLASAGDGPVEDGEVVLEPYLGLDTHTLPLPARRGAAGTVRIPYDDVHAPYINDQFARLTARYAGESAAAEVVLRPKHLEAEYVATMEGASREIVGDIRRKSPDVEAYVVAGDGGHVSYAPVNLYRIDAVTLRVLPQAGGTTHLRLDAPDGPSLGRIEIDRAEDDEPEWEMHRVPLRDPGGTRALFLTFEGTGDGPLFKLDWLDFHGAGVME